MIFGKNEIMATKDSKPTYEVSIITKTIRKGKFVEKKKSVLKTDDPKDVAKKQKELIADKTPLFEIVNYTTKKARFYTLKNHQKNYRITTLKLG